MFLPIKKITSLMKILKDINISVDEKTNSVVITTKRNLYIRSDENIIIHSKDDIIEIGKTIHLNPSVDDSVMNKSVVNKYLK